MKNKIRDSFNKAWRTYDQYSTVQKQACFKSIQLLLEQGDCFPKVADMACGTGSSTQSLIQHIDFEKMIAVDFCEKLLDVARNKNSDQRVQIIDSDFEERLFERASFDLIFCNMGLQWSRNLEYTLSLFYDYLQKDGVFVFSIPIDNTFPELKEDYRNSFYTLAALKDIVNRSRYHLEKHEVISIIDRFETPIEAFRSIKAVGANCRIGRDQIQSKRLSRNDIDNAFISQNDICLSYQIGIFVLKKMKAAS